MTNKVNTGMHQLGRTDRLQPTMQPFDPEKNLAPSEILRLTREELVGLSLDLHARNLELLNENERLKNGGPRRASIRGVGESSQQGTSVFAPCFVAGTHKESGWSFRDAPAMMALTRAHDGKFVDINNQFVSVLGFSRQEVVGKSAIDLDKNNTAFTYELVTEPATDGSSRCQHQRMKTRDQRELTLLCESRIIGDVSQKLVYTVAHDITSMKELESDLKRKESHYRDLFDSLSDLINMHSRSKNVADTLSTQRTLTDVSQNLQKHYIENALRKSKGKVQTAAKLLGITRFSLMRYMNKMDIDVNNFRQ